MDVIARGDGYLIANQDVIRSVDAQFPHACVHPDGRWEALGGFPPYRRVPDHRGRTTVVYSANSEFFPGLVVSLRSLLHFHPDVAVVVFSWDLSAAQEAWLRGFATVLPRRPDLPDDPAWGRLGLFHLDVPRAVYLDADTVVLRPIDVLLENTVPFGIVSNLDWGIVENFRDATLLRNLGLDPQLQAINTGVFTVDVRRFGAWLYDELLDLYARYGEHFVLGDQAAFSLSLYLHRHPMTLLPVEFNTMAEFWDWEADPATPRVLHFAGPSKPWHLGCRSPAQDYFFRWSRIPRPS